MRPRSQRRGRTSRTPAHTACSGTRRSASLLAASLHVALDELLGVLLEDVIDLVEELVDVFLDLLALLGQLRARGGPVSTFRGLRRPDFFLLLLCHLALHGATGRVAKLPKPLPHVF